MKIKTISTIILAASVAFACKPEKEIVPASPVQAGEQITITASSEGNPTKTVLQSDGTSIWWQADDSINLFYGPSVGGAKFDNTATEASEVTTFTGTLNSVIGASEGATAADKKFWGVYPYDAATEVTADGEIKMALQLGKQMTQAGTFAPAAFPSVACADGLTLKFYNVCGALAIDVEEEGVQSIILKGNNGEILNGDAVITLADGKPAVAPLTAGEEVIALYPDGAASFEKGKTYYMAVLPTTFSKGVTITLQKSAAAPVVLSTDKELKVERNKTNAVTAKEKELTIKTLWLKQSGDSAWNTYYGGTANTDRNIAMDDDYVYIAENSATAKMWAISISDPSVVKAVNVEGVADGGAHVLSCPRVIKNTDASVNGGKDVLICSSLTRGGVDPKLYMWTNGIDNAPKAITLTTWATGAWYGDTFTVYGTLQDGVLFFDKSGDAKDANGVVTFVLKGVPGNTMYLQGRLKFVDALGSHGGVCAYYPYPDNINTGVYSPGRGVEARGQNVVATGNLKGEGGFDVTLTPLDYDEGTNGYVLAYNFIEWAGKRYVIYGNQSSNKLGYIRVRQGELTESWANIASLGTRLYRRDLQALDGCTLTSGNSGMDITARVINGELYFAGQKQNIACGLYKLCYE